MGDVDAIATLRGSAAIEAKDKNMVGIRDWQHHYRAFIYVHRRAEKVLGVFGIVPVGKIALISALISQGVLKRPNEHTVPVNKVSSEVDISVKS